MSFKHLTANGSVDRGQPERATGGRGMANLVPRNPLEGKGARVACAPSHASPGGPGLRSQVRWGLFGGRGECGPVGVLVVGCARELWSRQPCS